MVRTLRRHRFHLEPRLLRVRRRQQADSITDDADERADSTTSREAGGCADVRADGDVLVQLQLWLWSPELHADERADSSTDGDGVTYCVSSPERDADERADSSTDGLARH